MVGFILIGMRRAAYIDVIRNTFIVLIAACFLISCTVYAKAPDKPVQNLQCFSVEEHSRYLFNAGWVILAYGAAGDNQGLIVVWGKKGPSLKWTGKWNIGLITWVHDGISCEILYLKDFKKQEERGA